jgi:hypothetical protein
LIAGIGSNNSGANGIGTEQDNPSLPYQYNIGETTAPWLLFHSFVSQVHSPQVPEEIIIFLHFYSHSLTKSVASWQHDLTTPPINPGFRVALPL